MMTFEQFSAIAATSPTVPLARSIVADMVTPVAAYLRIRRSHKHSFLFESVEGGERLGRYSFVGFAPEELLISRAGTCVRTDASGASTPAGRFFDALRAMTAGFRQPKIAGLPPFTGGLVGYLGYDIVREIERLPSLAHDGVQTDDACFGVFTKVIAFDHLHHQATLIVNVRHDGPGTLRTAYDRAVVDLDRMQDEFLHSATAAGGFHAAPDAIEAEMTEQQFLENVRCIKEHIREGDIFQLVLSQRFSTAFTGDPFQVYRALRIINPSPYLYYIDFSDVQLLGSSPEVLVRVQQGACELYPIAGTRPRGTTADDDRRLEAELRADAKECAEHIMLVDLGRNDLGRVCDAGSVAVREQMFLVQYSHVMHLASRVVGRLAQGKDAVDVIRAVFPAGTVSGAPKIRAMEIIEELEPSRRGIYAGGVGYIDFSGNLDLCIAIRTLIARNSRLFFQAGAGIVADSEPTREFEETLNKAQAMREAIRMAGDLPL